MYRRSRAPYVPNREMYLNHYRQRGSGGLPVFKGVYQDGSGLLTNFFRAVLPILRSTAASAGKTILSTGAKTLSDIVSGKSVKRAVTERGIEGLKDIGRDVAGRAVTALGKQQQKGGRATSNRRQTSRKRKSRVSDIFDDLAQLPAANKRKKHHSCVR